MHPDKNTSSSQYLLFKANQLHKFKQMKQILYYSTAIT